MDNTRGGPTFVVFLCDGDRSLRIVRCLSLRGAERAARLLEHALFRDMPEAGRTGARARAAAARTRWEVLLAQRQAYRLRPMSSLAMLGLGAAIVAAVLWTYFLRAH